jgi:hypothetical protein
LDHSWRQEISAASPLSSMVFRYAIFCWVHVLLSTLTLVINLMAYCDDLFLFVKYFVDR